jgi:uncharacterized protein YndB with AHSA1/START domain
MTNELTITAEPGTPFIDTERAFDAPAELLYRAFTEPDLLVQWLGPSKYEMIIDKYDARDGGEWRYINRGDGQEFAFHGVLHRIAPDQLVQTFEFEGYPGHVSLETLTFEERDGRTIVRTHSVFQSVADRDGMTQSGMESGMREGYERLDAVIGGLVPVAGR